METSNNKSVSEIVKFTEEEVKTLASIRSAYEQITINFGQLEMQKRELSKNQTRLNDRITAVENEEKVFLDRIFVRYGDGSFDLGTGIFTPKKTG